ncbi:hypothetical protein OF83DRAFT_22075 [Amylostereum chailletii]|nr:hypothetical protein OF83DRAFT_22075 [Amylostereum chailletii]
MDSNRFLLPLTPSTVITTTTAVNMTQYTYATLNKPASNSAPDTCFCSGCFCSGCKQRLGLVPIPGLEPFDLDKGAVDEGFGSDFPAVRIFKLIPEGAPLTEHSTPREKYESRELFYEIYDAMEPRRPWPRFVFASWYNLHRASYLVMQRQLEVVQCMTDSLCQCFEGNPDLLGRMERQRSDPSVARSLAEKRIAQREGDMNTPLKRFRRAAQAESARTSAYNANVAVQQPPPVIVIDGDDSVDEVSEIDPPQTAMPQPTYGIQAGRWAHQSGRTHRPASVDTESGFSSAPDGLHPVYSVSTSSRSSTSHSQRASPQASNQTSTRTTAHTGTTHPNAQTQPEAGPSSAQYLSHTTARNGEREGSQRTTKRSNLRTDQHPTPAQSSTYASEDIARDFPNRPMPPVPITRDRASSYPSHGTTTSTPMASHDIQREIANPNLTNGWPIPYPQDPSHASYPQHAGHQEYAQEPFQTDQHRMRPQNAYPYPAPNNLAQMDPRYAQALHDQRAYGAAPQPPYPGNQPPQASMPSRTPAAQNPRGQKRRANASASRNGNGNREEDSAPVAKRRRKDNHPG